MKEEKNLRPRRTFGMWLVALIFALVALLGGMRVHGAITLREQIVAVAANASIPYLVVSGALTFLGGLVGLGSIFLRRIWVPKAVLSAGAALSVIYWFDQFCFVENTTYISNAWGFSLTANVLLLGLLGWVLTRKRVQAYHQRKEIE